MATHRPFACHPSRLAKLRKSPHWTHRHRSVFRVRTYAMRRWSQAFANPDYNRERHQRWVRENPKKAAAITRKWLRAHPEKAAAIARKCTATWLRAHPGYSRTQNHMRRAGGKFTHQQFMELGDKCLCCGRTEAALVTVGLKLVPDHIVPVSKGGTNYISNIQPLCHGKGGCNNHKGTKTIDYRRNRAIV